MKQYIRVKVKSDNYLNDGVKKGDIGTIIEIYDKDNYEVEFFDENTGIDFAQTVIKGADLEEIDLETDGQEKATLIFTD